jgi:hypothetical protein
MVGRKVALTGAVLIFGTSAGHAQPTSHTVLMTCFVALLGPDSPLKFTPVAKVTMPPIPPGASFPATFSIVQERFTRLVADAQLNYSKSSCVQGESLEQIRKRTADWLYQSSISSKRPKQILPDEIWDNLLDSAYRSVRVGNPQLSRGMFSAVIVGKVHTDASPTELTN